MQKQLIDNHIQHKNHFLLIIDFQGNNSARPLIELPGVRFSRAPNPNALKWVHLQKLNHAY
jgi:hypothetical protein